MMLSMRSTTVTRLHRFRALDLRLCVSAWFFSLAIHLIKQLRFTQPRRIQIFHSLHSCPRKTLRIRQWLGKWAIWGRWIRLASNLARMLWVLCLCCRNKPRSGHFPNEPAGSGMNISSNSFLVYILVAPYVMGITVQTHPVVNHGKLVWSFHSGAVVIINSYYLSAGGGQLLNEWSSFIHHSAQTRSLQENYFLLELGFFLMGDCRMQRVQSSLCKTTCPYNPTSCQGRSDCAPRLQLPGS